jgi:hypothetical protein
MPYNGVELLRASTEMLGVVGPIILQWTLPPDAPPQSSNVSISVAMLGEDNPLEAIELPPSTRSWTWPGNLEAHKSYTIRIGSVSVHFRAMASQVILRAAGPLTGPGVQMLSGALSIYEPPCTLERPSHQLSCTPPHPVQ